MKRILAFMVCLLLLAMALCACGSDDEKKDAAPAQTATEAGAPTLAPDTQAPADTTTQAPADNDVDELSAFVRPADAFAVDMTAADPSNDDIRFAYDDEGRVISCAYQVQGINMVAGYQYQGGQVQIYAFAGEVLADDALITLPSEFDASKGFSVIEGYYFRGYGN